MVTRTFLYFFIYCYYNLLLFFYFSYVLLYRASIFPVPVNYNEEAFFFTFLNVRRSIAVHLTTVTTHPATSSEYHLIHREIIA